MANTGKKINKKELLNTLKNVGFAALGTIASGVVAKVANEKLLKVDANTTGIKTLLADGACTALGTVGAIKAKQDWQKSFSIGFAAGGTYRLVRKGVPKLNLSGLEGGGYYDQYGNYVAGVDEVYGYDEIGLSPISANSGYPYNIGEADVYEPSLPAITGIEAPTTSNGFYNDGTATVPALLGVDADTIL